MTREPISGRPSRFPKILKGSAVTHRPTPVISPLVTLTFTTRVAPLVPSVSTDELLQVTLLDEVFYLSFGIIAIFHLVPDVPAVQTLEVEVLLLPVSVYLRTGTSEVVLLHHEEYSGIGWYLKELAQNRG